MIKTPASTVISEHSEKQAAGSSWRASAVLLKLKQQEQTQSGLSISSSSTPSSTYQRWEVLAQGGRAIAGAGTAVQDQQGERHLECGASWNTEQAWVALAAFVTFLPDSFGALVITSGHCRRDWFSQLLRQKATLTCQAEVKAWRTIPLGPWLDMFMQRGQLSSAGFTSNSGSKCVLQIVNMQSSWEGYSWENCLWFNGRSDGWRVDPGPSQ